MDYYLYTHSNDNGIFYVGKGSGNRKAHKYNMRSKEWQAIADAGYTTKILKFSRNEKEIFFLEKILIKSLVGEGVKLVNKLHNNDFFKFLKNNKRKAERIEYWRNRQSLEAQESTL